MVLEHAGFMSNGYDHGIYRGDMMLAVGWLELNQYEGLETIDGSGDHFGSLHEGQQADDATEPPDNVA